MSSRIARALAVVALAAGLAGACGGNEPPVVRPTPPPPPSPTAPDEPGDAVLVEEPPVVPPEPMLEDPAGLDARSLDELNREVPLQPVFFPYDSNEIAEEGRAVLAANAELMETYPSWIVTIEGHCDERGTVEYNLALGERRALAVRSYLVSLGISGDRLRIVSYGEEFPFDPRSVEEAWAQNRRAHFVITAK